MGFLDSILGLKTTSAQNQAAGQAQQYQQAVGGANEQMLRGLNLDGQAALNTGANSAIGAINTGAAGAKSALTNYGGQAQQQLAAGRDAATQQVLGSNANYQPYAASGMAANGMLSNALGLNGAQGNAAATGAFQTSPGYNFEVNQASDNAARHAASLGMAASGNTLDAITRLGSNLADQQYGSWLDRLNGQSAQGLQAASGISGNNATAAGYDYNAGSTGATLSQQLGTALGNNAVNQGTQTANLYGGLGSALSNSNTTLSQLLSQNNQWKVNGVNQSALTNAQAQDAATNANNGVISGDLGTLGSDLLGGTKTGKGLTSFFSRL